MDVLIKKREVTNIINELANKLQISENEIVQKAIYEYAEKVKKKSRLMSFAGILGEKDADDLLKVIQESRTDKQLEIRIWNM